MMTDLINYLHDVFVIKFDAWVILGFLAQGLFTMRFVVQWIASERARASVVPVAFWFFSIGGGLLLLVYALYRKDPVFIAGQALGLVVYMAKVPRGTQHSSQLVVSELARAFLDFRACKRLKGDRPDRPDPAADLGGIRFIHVEEMGHHRPHDLLAVVVRRHCHDAAKDLQRSAIPVFGYVMECGEAGINERAQIVPDGFASVPVGDTEIARRVFDETVEAFAKSLVVDFLPKG